MVMLSILAATNTLPPGWEGWGIVGFLLFAVIGEAGAIYYLIKWKRDSDKDFAENYVSKTVYNDLKSHCDEEDSRCEKCIYVNGEVLRKIHEVMGEISASQGIEIQAQGAIKGTLENLMIALLKGGN